MTLALRLAEERREPGSKERGVSEVDVGCTARAGPAGQGESAVTAQAPLLAHLPPLPRVPVHLQAPVSGAPLCLRGRGTRHVGGLPPTCPPVWSPTGQASVQLPSCPCPGLPGAWGPGMAPGWGRSCVACGSAVVRTPSNFRTTWCASCQGRWLWAPTTACPLSTCSWPGHSWTLATR